MKSRGMMFAFLFLAFSCDTTEPPLLPDTRSIDLTLEDTGVTEAWLRVRLLDSLQGSSIRLVRDTTTILALTLTTTDTVILDQSLAPNQHYAYRAYSSTDSSQRIELTTLDTTSHNWTFVVDTIGGVTSSLRDVWIANENDIWAVGELNPGENTYNAVRWNGTQWDSYQFQFLSFCGQPSTGPYAAQSVFGFDAGNVWISSGSQMVRWNGTTQSTPVCIPVSVNKMWGPTPNSIYAVGVNGQIAHYDGNSWTQMLSPTDVDLLDVWGSPDGSVVWACGHYYNQFGTYLLRYSSGVWEIVYDGTASRFTIRNDSLSGAYSSVFARGAGGTYVAASAGLYSVEVNTRGEATRHSFTSGFFPGFPWRVRGDGVELFVVGEYYMVAHFNGITFRYFSELNGYGRLSSVDQRGNSVVAVGESLDGLGRAIAIRGSR